jgi:uncharacterized protein (DUF2249 family)
MGLSLSTAAAPALSLDALDAACRARGLDGEEIAIDARDDVDTLVARVVASRARVVALRAETFDPALAPAWARAAAKLGVPLSVPPDVVARAALRELAAVFAKAGARLLLGHGTSLDEVVALADAIAGSGAPEALGLAWEVRPSSESLAEASAVLFAADAHLGLVRLHGGGPEQHEQDGRGVGSLLVDLALAAYGGPIVLCPSRPELLPKWSRWLASEKSAGCGHRHDDGTIEVDARDVEPRNRLETILGAYKSLAHGATLKLTVDHDPSCMELTLRATEPEGSFEFQTVEHGPEVWRAEVVKR